MPIRTVVLRSSPFVLLLVALATWFYAPAFFQGKSQIHGDGILNGLALLDFHSRVLHEGLSALWSNQVYGGHPLFAEGQGAFAHPLNILVAWFFEPILGYNVFHWCCFVLSGIGMFGLCRSLGVSNPSSGFAAVALAFSSVWVLFQNNLGVGGTMVWIPWAMWGMEVWLRRPSLGTATFFGFCVALIILAGYPHILHGTVIYLLVSLLVLPFNREIRQQWRQRLPRWLTTGLLAIVICAGITAIQWLPLLELVGQSHRKEGIEHINFHALGYARGFFYSLPIISTKALHFPLLGSLFVCVLASMALLSPLSNRLKGHVLAIFVLIQLGLANESPLFNLLWDYHLLPGLHYFRVMMIYLMMVVVGVCLLAGVALDSLSKNRFGLDTSSRRWLPPTALYVGLALAWAWLIYRTHVATVPTTNYLVLLAAVVLTGLMFWNRNKRFIPLLMLSLLVWETAVLKLHSFHFADRELIAKPASLQQFEQQTDMDAYKVSDITAAAAYSFKDPQSPLVEKGMQRMLASLSASSNLLWDIASYDGAMALPLHRQRLILPEVLAEISGEQGRPPGLRLIDYLGIKYITVTSVPSTAALRLAYHDPQLNVTIVENTAARPRFQVYTRALWVSSPEAALEAVKKLDQPALVVERGVDSALASASQEFSSTGSNDTSAMVLDVTLAQPTRYRIDVSARRDAWLFIADANYPGWKARIDEREVAVHSAQVLGKAIKIPAGDHRVELYFESRAIMLGTGISAATLLMLLAMAAWSRRKSAAV